ncbi:hypothetical protein AS149_14165 [Burkholderia cenocepacia]|nr:hypothetical protein AS149_14165 [Burkholderia cenocepacia]
MIASPPANAAALSDPFGVLSATPVRYCIDIQPSDELSLADAVVLSLCRDPGLAGAIFSERNAQAAVGMAKAAYLPSLSLQGDVGRQSSTITGASTNSGNASDLTASLSYVLFDFGKRRATLQQSLANASVQRYARVGTYQQVMLDTAADYIALISLQLQAKAASDEAAAADEALTMASAKYKAGEVARSDVLQAKTVAAQARLTVVQAESTLRTAQAKLAVALGWPVNSPIRLTPAEVRDAAAADLQPLDAMLAEAATARPDILAAKAQLQADGDQITIARAQYLPTLSVTASSGTSTLPGSPRTRTGSAMLSLRIPLFNGFERQYSTAAATASRDQSAETLKSVQRAAALDVFTQREQLSTALSALASANAFADSASESVEVALKQYKAGVGTMYDLLNAQSQLAQARTSVAQSYATLEQSRLALAKALGQLSLDSL